MISVQEKDITDKATRRNTKVYSRAWHLTRTVFFHVGGGFMADTLQYVYIGAFFGT